MSDVQKGLDSARYNIEGKQIFAVMSMIAGTVLSSMFLVLEGFKTWREIGSESAELILRALGLDSAEAQHIANIELPNLKEV
ncbi:hypothetical protein [Acinetobacter cumulans]|uniref:hypothetical protein n=1 Tax=Acinetobacter cumulans TaxID=2136182 RepID=UPI001D1877AA|nr:hypothetical protein [Acinetobacter cumulans]